MSSETDSPRSQHGFQLIETPNDGDEYVRRSPYGHIRGYQRGNDFRILYIEVKPQHRRQGHGTEMMHAAVILARELGAATISASIYSAEMYQLVSAKFGSDCLDIKTLDACNKTTGNAAFVYPLPLALEHANADSAADGVQPDA